MHDHDHDAMVNRMALDLNESPGLVRYWLGTGQLKPNQRPNNYIFKGGCHRCPYQDQCTTHRLWLRDEGPPCEIYLYPFGIRAIANGGYER